MIVLNHTLCLTVISRATECHIIRQQCDVFEHARIGDPDDHDEEIIHLDHRSCDEVTLSWDEENTWLFEKLSNLVINCNKDYYGYDLVGFSR